MSYCLIHSGKHNAGNRENMEEIMGALDHNQGGAGRHKCPYCAYKEGYERAKKDAVKKINELKSPS